MSHPIPLVQNLLTTIQSAATWSELDSARDVVCKDWRILHTTDQAVITAVGTAQRAKVAWSYLWGSLANAFEPTFAESAPTVENTLASIVVEAATNAAAIAPRRTRGPATTRRSQSATEITTATIAARAAGARLAGYSGQIVDPSKGAIGMVIAFGKAELEMDVVSGEYRQKMILWSDVTTALASAGLDADTLGNPVTEIAHLGQAVGILNHSGWIARRVKTLDGSVSWAIGLVDTNASSARLASREVTITLHNGQIAASDPASPQANLVIDDYYRRVAGTLIEASDLMTRMQTSFVRNFGAKNTDLGLYVPSWNQDRAMALVLALRPVAARKIYAYSHTDAASISEALLASLECDLSKLEIDTSKASTDLKKLAGAKLIERIERLKNEAVGLSKILADGSADALRARLQVCDDQVTAALDATSQRFANLELT